MKQTTQLVLIILALIGAMVPTMLHNYNEKQVRRQFQQWTIKYGKQFKDQYQKAYRLQIFKQNKIKVEQHNKLADLGKYKYYMGLNQFATTTLIQYKHNYEKLKIGQAKSPNTITTKCKGTISDTPEPKKQISWKQTAVYDAVANQGKCSANWALSAVAALEGLYARQKGDKIKFSDQQLIDCSGDYGNEGCGGGFMDQAYWYVIDQGLAYNQSYPYRGTKQKCKYNPGQRELSITQCARIPTENYQKLISAINQQPVSVAIASQSFVLYITGIFDGECTTDLDRGMLLVGYGKEKEQDGGTEYWILKNSVGAGWGQKGYIRLKKTAGNGPGLCGIQIAASVPQGLK